MKKKIHFISLFLILVMIVSAVAVSASKSFDPDDLVMITSDIVNIKAEARLELSVDFYIPTEDIDYLEEHANNLRVYAIVVDYTDKVVDPKDDLGLSMDLKKGDVRTVNGVSCYTYNFDLGVILPEDYNSSYAVRGFISYELSGRSYKTASDFFFI